tara:strand:- start:1774 stop:2517 length:744 start_codon:yes stop_codon:yes gene_type:complete
VKPYTDFYTKGFQVIPNVLNREQILNYKKLLDDVYDKQLTEFKDLELIGEQNTVRSPFLYDLSFYELFYSSFTNKIVKDILGEHAILSLQNGILIPANHFHHQAFYHRDLIYQEFTSSRPLSFNLYYCLDDYTLESGGTTFIPFSHKKEKMPIHYNEETPTVKKGSVILFDSMTYHKAGINKTKSSRYGINNMYTLPFIKQQINYPYYLKEKTKDSKLNRLLGFESREFLSVNNFRQYRLKRKKNEK